MTLELERAESKSDVEVLRTIFLNCVPAGPGLPSLDRSTDKLSGRALPIPQLASRRVLASLSGYMASGRGPAYSYTVDIEIGE